jgi:hypothetical protein
MSELRTLNPAEFLALLTQARDDRASASLRADGSLRMLGQLRVAILEPEEAVQLVGTKLRDNPPPSGSPVTFFLVMGPEAMAMRATMLEPLVGDSSTPPILRISWPAQPVEVRLREEVRVATPDLPPLEAVLVHKGQRFPAKLLNITETGMGLGLGEVLDFQPQDRVEVETCLPGGEPFRASGELRHFQVIEEEELPTRLGMVLEAMPAFARESLRRLVQARRMFLSLDLREGQGDAL